MKKLKLSFGKEMTKEQMKKITGGYNCRTEPQTVYVCATSNFPSPDGCVYCYDDCMEANGASACASAGFGAFIRVACPSEVSCIFTP